VPVPLIVSTPPVSAPLTKGPTVARTKPDRPALRTQAVFRMWMTGRGLSIAELARVIDLNPKYVSRVLCGIDPVSEAFRARVAKSYGTEVADLLVQGREPKATVSDDALRAVAKIFASAIDEPTVTRNSSRRRSA
jgi:transcriptional regulator with XRE-family HTH domain